MENEINKPSHPMNERFEIIDKIIELLKGQTYGVAQDILKRAENKLYSSSIVQ